MKKSKSNSSAWKVPALAIAMFLIAGGAFAFSAGLVQASGSSLAAVFSAFFGNPTVMISRSNNSPSGTLSMGRGQVLAIFDVRAQNVTHWATLKHVSGQIAVDVQSTLSLSNVSIYYDYCIPAGKTYGYGWKGGHCADIVIPTSVQNTGSGYTLTFDGSVPIYPEASPGSIVVASDIAYRYTGTARNTSGDGTLQVRFNSAVAAGDQCKTIQYGYKNRYGYQGGCVSKNAAVGISGAGNVLTVKRLYGYGYYYPLTITRIKPTPLPTPVPVTPAPPTPPAPITPPAASNNLTQGCPTNLLSGNSCSLSHLIEATAPTVDKDVTFLSFVKPGISFVLNFGDGTEVGAPACTSPVAGQSGSCQGRGFVAHRYAKAGTYKVLLLNYGAANPVVDAISVTIP